MVNNKCLPSGDSGVLSDVLSSIGHKQKVHNF